LGIILYKEPELEKPDDEENQKLVREIERFLREKRD